MTLPNVDSIKTHITRVADAAAAITARSAEHAEAAAEQLPPPAPIAETDQGATDDG